MLLQVRFGKPARLICRQNGHFSAGFGFRRRQTGPIRPLLALHLDSDLVYLEGHIREEIAGEMAFKTLKTKRAPVTLEAWGEAVERRRAVLGKVEIPRNAGTRRTPSKRALLKAIEDAGGQW
jgi:hypothetical protein